MAAEGGVIYLGITAIWAVVLYLLLRPKQKAELSEYTKALEALGRLIPDSIDRIGNAIQANLYPSLTLAQSQEAHPSGQTNGEVDVGPVTFEAVAPFPLDWENVDEG